MQGNQELRITHSIKIKEMIILSSPMLLYTE